MSKYIDTRNGYDIIEYSSHRRRPLLPDALKGMVGFSLYFGRLAAPVPAAVPDGWVMVPEEPTDAMWRAANAYENKCAIQNYGGCADAAGIWEAMLAASKEGKTP